ncbi:hypothetical protein RND71_022943 [Anisodus tanguticus]|uniref:Uncharacterized protein n=1 Tax=Anisodus tanguticus TaxID=243964 RepID=A0AAE1RUQ6_9SOLA|nr:hypothetical protein RND71_022943 [Anisodus tanguticus]
MGSLDENRRFRFNIMRYMIGRNLQIELNDVSIVKKYKVGKRMRFIINTFWVTMGNQISIESPPNSKNMNGDIEIEFRHLEIVGNKEKGPKKFVSIKEITQERCETKQIPATPSPSPSPTPTPTARRRHFINVK